MWIQIRRDNDLCPCLLHVETGNLIYVADRGKDYAKQFEIVLAVVLATGECNETVVKQVASLGECVILIDKLKDKING